MKMTMLDWYLNQVWSTVSECSLFIGQFYNLAQNQPIRHSGIVSGSWLRFMSFLFFSVCPQAVHRSRNACYEMHLFCTCILCIPRFFTRQYYQVIVRQCLWSHFDFIKFLQCLYFHVVMFKCSLYLQHQWQRCSQ